MKKIIYLIIAIATLSSCYEYRKLPNTKRVTKRQVKQAMKYSTWQYEHRPTKAYNVSYPYNK